MFTNAFKAGWIPADRPAVVPYMTTMIVTHAHPDHYAGAATILEGRTKVPILSTSAVRDMIARDDAIKDQIVGPMMGAEWPGERRFPDTPVNGSIELGDLAPSL